MPAAGEDPQLDAQSRVPLLVGLSVAFVAVSTVAVLLRLFTRYAVVRAPGTDDLTIAVAQFLSIGVSITTILQAKYALGRHVWVTNQTDQLKQLKAFFAGMLVYNLAQILTKLSFLFQYRRIFQDERTRRACLWLLMLLTAWGVAQEILVGFSCVPVSMFIPGHRAMCINSLVVWYLTSIMNIVTDFVVFMVPMPAIKNLQLQRKQKILVTSVFCLGFFTCAISIVRLFTLHAAINAADPTWDNVPSAYWSIVELNCGILCASLPPLRPLIRRVFPALSQQRSHLSTSPRARITKASTVDGSRKRSSSDGSGGPLAAWRQREGNRDHRRSLYPLQDVPSSLSSLDGGGVDDDRDSREGLKEAAAAASYYRSPGYATHSGRVSRLMTNIEGGGGDMPAGGAGGGGGGSGDARPRSGQHAILVTREIGYKNSIDEALRQMAELGGEKESGR